MEKMPTKDKIKSLILETVAKEKPETVEELRQIMLRQHVLNPESTNQLIIELENEGKLHFTPIQPQTRASAIVYVFSEKVLWFWGVIALSIAAIISVFLFPEAVYPLAYVRNVFGLIFVLFLPGFALGKLLFPKAVPIKTSSEQIDNIERIAISLGLSLALVPIVGLALNYTPWGVRLAPIVLSLLVLTVGLSTVAVMRDRSE